MGLTNLEALITSLVGFYTRRGYNGSVVTTANFVQLSSTSVPAQLVYIAISWIWGTATTKNWGASSGKNWGS